jgi:hypothetical protein
MSTEPVISTTEPSAVATLLFQPIRPIVEPVQMENPQFFGFQPTPISSHSTKTLKHINMFLK